MTTYPSPFDTGDIVRLKNGNAPQRVTELRWFDKPKPRHHLSKHRTDGWFLKAVYLSNCNPEFYPPSWRTADDYTLFKPEEKPMTKTLYRVLKTEEYGTFLAVDSEDRMVLEMAGGAGVAAFHPDELEVVVPHTVLATEPGSNKKVHFQIPKGKVKVGSLLFRASNNCVYMIEKVDTKSQGAVKMTGDWYVLAAEKLDLDK